MARPKRFEFLTPDSWSGVIRPVRQRKFDHPVGAGNDRLRDGVADILAPPRLITSTSSSNRKRMSCIRTWCAALGLFHLAHLRGCLLQPELQVQIAVYGRRVCEMRMGLVGLTCAPVELT